MGEARKNVKRRHCRRRCQSRVGTQKAGGLRCPYRTQAAVAITMRRMPVMASGSSPSPVNSSQLQSTKPSPLELALHAALDARGPPSRRSRLPSGAGSANTGQSMVKIVSKHHRVLDAANELMWTRLAVEAPSSGTDSQAVVNCTARSIKCRPSRVVWSRRRCSNPCSTSWTLPVCGRDAVGRTGWSRNGPSPPIVDPDALSH